MKKLILALTILVGMSFGTTYHITQTRGSTWCVWKTYGWRFINDNTIQFTDASNDNVVIVCGNFSIEIVEK